jgi:hypothetical protein
VTNILLPEFSGVTPSAATFNAGFGGNGDSSRGGKGGAVTGVQIKNGDFSTLAVNTGNAADGGSSAGSKGGAGGGVSRLNFVDLGLGGDASSVTGILTIRTGNGGDGGTGGGSGGALRKSSFSASI